MPALGENDGRDCGDDEDDAGGGAHVKDSERARTPMTTAVRGSRAPRMALRVGPIRLMAATRVMLETAVPSRAIPRILAQRKPSERGTRRTPPNIMPSTVKLTAPKPMT